jgi:hypothetical protein
LSILSKMSDISTTVKTEYKLSAILGMDMIVQ